MFSILTTLSAPLLALAPALVFSAQEGPPEDEQLKQEVGDFLQGLSEEDKFSGAVLIARGEEILFRQAYGEASKRFAVPNRVDTKFNLGSMNKMFTGVAICMLAEQKMLSFEDKVGVHLPEYPNKDVREKVTIHHLLTHTSGMGSYWNEAFDRNWKNLRTLADLQALFQDDPLSFEPGERFQYSNAGPTVLGLIIEAISGQSYYDYVREHIFKPCGMESTDSYELDIPEPNVAQGYTHMVPNSETRDGPWRNNILMHSVKGAPAGGGYSTVDDLLRFSIAMQFNELLGEEMTEILLTGKVRMGPGMKYAYLFGDRGRGERRTVGHNGGAPGISADFKFYPESGYTVAVLANYDEAAMPVSHFINELLGR